MRTADLRLRIPFALALALAGLAVPAQAQRERWGNGWLGVTVEPNVPYDGRFTFARIRYTVYGRSGWQFDYPQMERNLLTMMRELTTLRPHVEGSNIHTLDDPARILLLRGDPSKIVDELLQVVRGRHGEHLRPRSWRGSNSGVQCIRFPIISAR